MTSFKAGDRVVLNQDYSSRYRKGDAGVVRRVTDSWRGPDFFLLNVEMDKGGDTEAYARRWDPEENESVTSMNTELEEYKKRVYEVAKGVKDTEGWCDSGFKEAMRELDILPEPDKYPKGTVVGCGSIRGNRVARKVTLLDGQWEITGYGAKFTFEEMLGVLSVTEENLVVLWSPSEE